MTGTSIKAEVKHQLHGKNFLTLADFTPEELMYLIDYGLQLKNEQKNGIPHRILEGKTLAMIFEKSSTRTRVSFEAGMFQLGGHRSEEHTSELQSSGHLACPRRRA